MDTQTEIKKEKPSENGETGGRGGGRGGFPRSRGGFRGGRGGVMDGVMNALGRQHDSSSEENLHNDQGSYRGGYRGRGRGRGRGGMLDGGRYGPPDRIAERLKALAGPMIDLPPREEGAKKFSNHCRLWIGNLPLDITEEDVKEMFKPFGEFDEVYFDKTKGFAFVRLDYKSNAEKAKQDLHLKEYHGRQLKIRFSNPGTALKIRNLSQFVTNELLEKSFSVFGDVEKAIVVTDDRGRSTGDGIVEFCKKPCAQIALKKAGEGCFFLTTSPRPVIVEPLTVVDDSDGFCEMNINKRNPEYVKERQNGPRFAAPGSFEFEYGLKWKQLYELFDKKKEMLEKELADEKKKLEEQIEYAKYQHETELLREQLMAREEVNARNKAEYEQRQLEWDDHRRQEEERQRQIEEELSMKFRQQEEELRRRQEENRQFMQQHGQELMAEQEAEGFGDYDGSWRPSQDSYGQGGASWRGRSDGWNRGRGGAQSGQWGEGYDVRGESWQGDARYGRPEGELVAAPERLGFGGPRGRGTRGSYRGAREASRGRWETAAAAEGGEFKTPAAKRARF